MNSAERDKGHLAVLTRRRYHAILAGGRACNALGPASQQAKHRRQHAILYYKRSLKPMAIRQPALIAPLSSR